MGYSCNLTGLSSIFALHRKHREAHDFIRSKYALGGDLSRHDKREMKQIEMQQGKVKFASHGQLPAKFALFQPINKFGPI